MELRSHYLQGETVETIYFGGGTPSLLPVSDIRLMLESIYKYFNVGNDPEITLESNPDDMLPEYLNGWKQAGINRLSIGVQSFFPEDLQWMNRAHGSDQAIHAVEEAKKAGFENFSLDLIFGSPGLTDEKWLGNLRKAVSLDPPHISCYALTVEPKTALFKMIRMKESPDVQPDIQAAQFMTGMDILESAGFEHYEISSFSKPGKRSRHNSSYWQSKKYLGLGPSAHSFNGNSRQWNISNNALYISALKGGSLSYEAEELLPKDRLNEYIMTSLRTMEGLDLQFVKETFGEEKRISLENQALTYISLHHMEHRLNKLVLTREGKMFADGIASALFFE